MRALVAAWWRKGDRARWTEDHLTRLVDTLAGTLPEYRLPTGAIHAHTRHYMPTGGLDKGRPKTTLVFDAFLRLPEDATLVAAWPQATLDAETFAFASHLAGTVGYLGRAESWTECEALAEWDGARNCRPLDGTPAGEPVRNAKSSGAETRPRPPLGGPPAGDHVRLLAPRTPAAYATERQRIIDDMKQQMIATARRLPTPQRLEAAIDNALKSEGRQAHTLPERLVDALALDTADYQDRGWSRPPAAREVVYARAPEAAPGVVTRAVGRLRGPAARESAHRRPLPARRPPVAPHRGRRQDWRADAARRPRAVRLGDGRGREPPAAGTVGDLRARRRREAAEGPVAPARVLAARGCRRRRLDRPRVRIHRRRHNREVQARLDRITRLWLAPKQQTEAVDAEPGAVKEWRLALEGFGRPADFADGARIFGTSRRWRSVTPFLASGHLKAAGYPGEVRRLLKRRGLAATDIQVEVLKELDVGGTPRRAIHFHRFRSRGREAQPDAAGALLDIVLPRPLTGPLAIGYGSHFGLGLFRGLTGRRVGGRRIMSHTLVTFLGRTRQDPQTGYRRARTGSPTRTLRGRRRSSAWRWPGI